MMDALALALIGLRGAALGLQLHGQSGAANSLFALADAAEAGKAVDAHMQLVADKLKERNANFADWSDVATRINAASEDLQR